MTETKLRRGEGEGGEGGEKGEVGGGGGGYEMDQGRKRKVTEERRAVIAASVRD